jgi:hypothetical protein
MQPTKHPTVDYLYQLGDKFYYQGIDPILLEGRWIEVESIK